MIFDFLFHKNIDYLRSRHYNLTIKRDEILPSSVWGYLVKRRAEFKCEGCSSTKNLQAHHIIPFPEGKSVLKNGKCLCVECHGKTRIIIEPKRKTFNLIFRAIGKQEYVKFMKELYIKIRDHTGNKIVKSIPKKFWKD